MIKTYDEHTDFSFDANNFEFDSGLKLALQHKPGQVFTENFDNDTGHTYDINVSEFSGGKWQQKPDLLDSALCGTNYFDDGNTDLMFGSGDLTGSVVEGAISGGVANLQGATGNRKYLQYDNPEDFLAGSELKGTIIFTWIAGDTFSPSINHGIWNTDRVTDFNWQTALFYDAGVGGLRLIMFNGTGGTQINLNYAWTPTQGQTYEIALAYDFEITGTVSIYVDKTRVATVTSATYLTIFAAKSYAGMRLRLGTDRIAAWYADCEFDGWIHYDEYLLTGATYTEDYAMSNFYYSDSYDTLPEIEYTGAGALVSFDSFTYTKTGDALVALQIGRSGVYTYWNGSAWVTGDGTKDYMCTFSNFAANVATLDIDGELYGQFKVFLPESNTQGYIDELTSTLTTQIYSTSNLSSTTAPVLLTQGYISLTVISTEDLNDYLKHVVKVDGQKKYWNNTSWVDSVGYAESNTTSELESNISSLDLSEGVGAYIETYHHSNDGSGIPVLTSITTEYDFYAGDAVSPNKCIVYGNISDITDDSDTTEITVYLNREIVTYNGDKTIRNVEKTITPNENGYWEIEVIETENMQAGTYYIFNFGANVKFTCSVPNEESKRFQDLEVI